MEFKREVCALIADSKLISLRTDNSSGFVNFDFFKAWEYWKENKFEVLYMIHSHPIGFNRKSSIDKNMVCGWAKTFPIPIIYIIVSGFDSDDTVVYLFHYKNNKYYKIKLGYSTALNVSGTGNRFLYQLYLTSMNSDSSIYSIKNIYNYFKVCKINFSLDTFFIEEIE